MKNLYLPKSGKILKRADALECLWCVAGKDPAPHYICQTCHERFKKLLNSAGWRRLCRVMKADRETCYCVDCLPQLVSLQVVDHIKPWSLYPSLFWEPTNHQGLCQTHHNRKSRTDGSAPIKPYGNAQ